MKRTVYLSTKDPVASQLDDYPNTGPHPNITGMRKQYWGKEALIVKCGAYIYNLSSNPTLFEVISRRGK